MRFVLNIGLDNIPVVGESFTNGVRNPLVASRYITAIQAVRAAGFSVYKNKRVQSDTEPTLVAEVMFMGHLEQLHAKVTALSDLLQQDCIAVYNPITGQGDLIGPRAAEWGPFNPEFFILLDGTRLATPAAKAA